MRGTEFASPSTMIVPSSVSTTRLRLAERPASRAIASESACSELLIAAIFCVTGRDGCAATSKPSAEVSTASAIPGLEVTNWSRHTCARERTSAANRKLGDCMGHLLHLRFEDAEQRVD